MRHFVSTSAIATALVTLMGGAYAQTATTRVSALRERGDYDEAITLARQEHLANALGELLVLRGRLTEAADAFHTALAGASADSLTARLNLALLQQRRGEQDSARSAFERFIDVYNGVRRLTSKELEAVGTAVQRLSVYDPALAHDALRAYDEAIAADPDNSSARLRVGQLFLDRYNGTEARAAFQGILTRVPKHPQALLGMARTVRFEGSRRATDLARQALDENPSLVAARVFLAELYMEVNEYDHAERELDDALAVNPAALNVLAMQAALAFLRGDDRRFQDLEHDVLARNPAYADLYTTLANASARNRRYREAAGFARRATTLDGNSWRGFALLGINQLRLGSMDSGRANLERAFAGDPFDVWTKNTLDLLDTLDAYPTHASARFRFYVDGEESELLALYLGEIAEAAYDSLVIRYAYAPATPIRIEVFPSHADFSVRTVGLVGLGALGVSFGPVIAMDSPSAREPGAFNWGSTLWHEIAHTFHLGATDNRVPRWLTEGLAVYEERRARPGWGDDASPAFLAAFKQGRLLSVGDLNDGFLRPAFPEQLIFSYYEGSLISEYIEETFGITALRGMLEGYRDGLTTPDVFTRVLDRNLDGFDREYTRWFRERFAGPLAAVLPQDSAGHSPARIAQRARRDHGDFFAQLMYGQILVRAGQDDEAIPYLERAKALFPSHADRESAYALLARIYEARGDHQRAAAELARLTYINERAYTALVRLADLRLTMGDSVGAAGALQRAMYVYPYDLDMHRRLATLAESVGRPTVAVRERLAVLALRPVNVADAWYRLARAHLFAGDGDEARRAVLRALEIAPGFAAAQELLLELHERQ